MAIYPRTTEDRIHDERKQRVHHGVFHGIEPKSKNYVYDPWHDGHTPFAAHRTVHEAEAEEIYRKCVQKRHVK